jgi:DNA-binding transcriptional regulator YiaG
LVRGVSARERMQRLEQDPARAAQFSIARQTLGKAMQTANAGKCNLAALRLQAGLSQEQFAKRMGTQQSNISRWEREPSAMQVDSILKIATVLGVSPAEVFEAVSLYSTAENAAV